ncbi:hypothetical protein CBOM_06054 [Ceraceosorus bombacis]|uniref:Uncharacterized protein n=1 Tax=Ceraceosorus bombacis TaxID=401625 RepID=A0A0P1BJ63_9BASI|nr:hypothetical protein CBOM_06054 [Ceraceosorus bombacis]
MRQRRSASPVAGSHLALSASTNHADGTPSRHDRDRLLSVPLARSHAASNEGLGTPRAPALQWVSSPIPRHWTLNPLARGRAGQEGGDEEAMMMMMTPSKHDLPLDPSATPAAAALVKHFFGTQARGRSPAADANERLKHHAWLPHTFASDETFSHTH